MKYMLLTYDNPDTRQAFFGPGSEGLMNEMQAIMEELRQSGELLDTAPLGVR